MSSLSELQLLQVNLHHSVIATAKLRKWLEVNHTAIGLIQEPWIRGGTIRGLSDLGGRLICANISHVRTCI